MSLATQATQLEMFEISLEDVKEIEKRQLEKEKKQIRFFFQAVSKLKEQKQTRLLRHVLMELLSEIEKTPQV